MVENINQEIEKHSKELLADLVKEINQKGEVFKPVRIGHITEIRKSDDYETSKMRLFIIKYLDGVVLMNEEDASEQLQKEKRASRIVGIPVAFMPTHLDKLGRIFVSTNEIYRYYNEIITNKKIFNGTVRGVVANQEHPDQEELRVDVNGQDVFIKREDLGVFYSQGIKLAKYIGRPIKIWLKEVTNSKVYACGNVKAIAKRDSLVEKMMAGEVYTAKIKSFNNGGAILEIEGIPAILRHSDFSDDWMKVNDVKKVGDTILVKFNSLSKNKRLHVEPVEKYKVPYGIDPYSLKRGDLLIAKVTSITPYAVFVNIAQRVDALCSVPPFIREPEIGDNVSIKLISVNPEENKIRATIIGFAYDKDGENKNLKSEEE